MAAKVEPTGLGGSMNVVFVCNGCESRTVNFVVQHYLKVLRELW